ncbi:MAG: hypothetical protein HY245_13215 [Rhizobiales bacterium]|nr:hypothetical protein [Hyphomicrobiales bacterium]MBI3674350.1 hypothetical protein [Hyphomicrobiales bacterium]
MLSGYKTYILAGLTVIGAAANYLVGDADLNTTVQLVITALMGAFVRHAVAAGPTVAK